MFNRNIEIVEELNNGNLIIRVEKEIVVNNETKKVIKFTIADKNGIVTILDSKGNLSGIQFFDNYSINKFGDIIIGIKKDGEEYYNRILSHFDLSDTKVKITESPYGPFNIGPYYKQYYNYESPTKTIEDIIPQSYSFNYGLINRDGLLVIYPMYDEIKFGTEDTCIVGLLNYSKVLKFGYKDILSGNDITPVCFDMAVNFSYSRALVKYEGKYGYINRKKIMTNPENYDEYAKKLSPRFFGATPFIDDGVATVVIFPGDRYNSSARVKIDTNGEIIEILLPPKVFRKMNNDKRYN